VSSLAGTLPVARHALRRDRLLVAVWVVLLVAVVYASAAATPGLYSTDAERVDAARAINANPAVVALYGPILDVHSEGELAMTKTTVLYAVFVALLLLVVVRRHTRTEEETGRAELLAGTAIGPDTLLAAAVAIGAAVSMVVGVLAAIANIAGGLPVVGSVAFGATWTGVGLVAVGVTAVACQLAASSRTCAGIAGGAIALLYLLRAVGDVGPTWLSWLTPFGWSTRMRAWDDPRWWVLLLYAVVAAGLVVGAHLLRARRDLGSGLFAARPGPRVGSPRLADAVALAWRQHRATLLSWTVAVAALGVVMGAIAPGVGDLLDNDAGRELLESLGGAGALQDVLLAAVLSIAAVVITCFGVSVVAHAGTDEHDGRTEEVLATATSRSRSFAAVVTVAAGGAAWLLAVCGLATAVGLGQDAGELVESALSQLPAVLTVIGLAVLLAALRSSWAVLGWGFVALCVVVGQLGELLHLPGWVTGLSPYSHVPSMPVEAFGLEPTLVLSALAAALLVTAWWRYGERDIG
jgi:ABC-2 type transport system permease protein